MLDMLEELQANEVEGSGMWWEYTLAIEKCLQARDIVEDG